MIKEGDIVCFSVPKEEYGSYANWYVYAIEKQFAAVVLDVDETIQDVLCEFVESDAKLRQMKPIGLRIRTKISRTIPISLYREI